MGLESTVSGYIRLWDREDIEPARLAISEYAFDEIWPFTNIFWTDSPAEYWSPVIGFAGSYSQVEEAWSEWLWKFAQLLSLLNAVEATVYLACTLGDYLWRLRPESWQDKSNLPIRPSTGQLWGITKAPEKDFSIDPKWLAYAEANIQDYKWDRFVPRWLSKES